MGEVAWNKYNKKERKEIDKLCEDYKKYISIGKTERDCVKLTLDMIKKAGYVDIDEAIKKGLKPGSKFYAVNKARALALFQLGEEPIRNGMNILGAHIDSPRFDIKQNPLYEDSGLAYLDTHYYGGIKKYQWVTVPMAIHGVVCKKDGTTIDIMIGEDPKDPVFCFTDLLVHLAAKQIAKPAVDVLSGEKMDLLVGGLPLEESKLKDGEKNAVKANILEILRKKYKFEEEDFASADLAIVPAGPARDLGFDRSMIIGYGQDDKLCAYTSVVAFLDEPATQKRTGCCLIVDKEEIGSTGATGMDSNFFENVVAKIAKAQGGDVYMDTMQALENSCMLSSDVTVAYDPLFSEPTASRRNTGFLGCGMAYSKYSGSKGKVQSSEASAEYVAKIRRIMDDNDVAYQFCELGDVDAGGGGTIARFICKKNMDVIDSGVCVLSIHAPYEITSKVDVYEAYKGYRAFLRDA